MLLEPVRALERGTSILNRSEIVCGFVTEHDDGFRRLRTFCQSRSSEILRKTTTRFTDLIENEITSLAIDETQFGLIVKFSIIINSEA